VRVELVSGLGHLLPSGVPVKQYSSRFLKTLALLLMAFPITYLVAAALIFDIAPEACVRILLSPGFELLSVMAMISGWGLWEMRRWSWYVFLATALFATYYNALLALDYGESHHRSLAFLLSVGVIVGLVIRVSKELRVPYFLPRIRWWESNPRYKLIVPVTLQRKNTGETLQGEILDLSYSGCFIKLRSDLEADETLDVVFTIFGQQVELSGTVVWRTQSAVTHPKGIGLKFSPFNRIQKRLMKAVNSRLRRIAQLYRNSRYLMSQEEFFRRMEELQSHRLDLPATITDQSDPALRARG
jgi:uncharacterized membrane protein (DUF2068 family)